MSAARFDRCIQSGGIALFPADTVYGLACAPADRAAVDRLFAIKRRPVDKAAAVMFFSLAPALEALPGLHPLLRDVLRRLLPGPVTVLLENAGSWFPLAGASGTLGLRVVRVPALEGARCAVLQSSANLSGAPAPRRLEQVVPEIREQVDLVIDGGELPGIASTVVDLRGYERSGAWRTVRLGALSEQELAAVLG